jgi:hypothetical protein
MEAQGLDVTGGGASGISTAGLTALPFMAGAAMLLAVRRRPDLD